MEVLVAVLCLLIASGDAKQRSMYHGRCHGNRILCHCIEQHNTIILDQFESFEKNGLDQLLECHSVLLQCRMNVIHSFLTQRTIMIIASYHCFLMAGDLFPILWDGPEPNAALLDRAKFPETKSFSISFARIGT